MANVDKAAQDINYSDVLPTGQVVKIVRRADGSVRVWTSARNQCDIFTMVRCNAAPWVGHVATFAYGEQVCVQKQSAFADTEY